MFFMMFKAFNHCFKNDTGFIVKMLEENIENPFQIMYREFLCESQIIIGQAYNHLHPTI